MMVVRFEKDIWVKLALKRRYLIANRDGSILRANKADAQGVVDPSKGYHTVKVQIHKPTGRVYFMMSYMGFRKAVLVNRVIAWRWHPNPQNLPQVNHKDGDKENNADTNLEWATNSENEIHAHRTGLKSGRGTANSNAKLTPELVQRIRASDRSAESWATELGLSRSTIQNVVARRTWSHIK